MTARSIKARTKRGFRAAAQAVPQNTIQLLKSRAIEAVNSGEPHKITGGWVAQPFFSQGNIPGLLEVAIQEIKAAQIAAWQETKA